MTTNSGRNKNNKNNERTQTTNLVSKRMKTYSIER